MEVSEKNIDIQSDSYDEYDQSYSHQRRETKDR